MTMVYVVVFGIEVEVFDNYKAALAYKAKLYKEYNKTNINILHRNVRKDIASQSAVVSLKELH